MTRGVHDPMSPSRSVRRPGNTEYDLAVAKDICRSQHGVNWEKARRLPYLPLFFVAVDGKDGMAAAERFARERRAA